MRHAYPVLVISALNLVSACAAPDEGSPTEVLVGSEQHVGVSWEEYRDRAKAAARGQNYYIAEWDLVFSTEESLRAHYDETFGGDRSKLAVFKRLSNGFEPVFVGADAVDIVYCVSNTFSNKATVIADIAVATQRWQDTVNVRFAYDATQDATCTQNNTNVDFAVMPMSGTGLVGCAMNKMMSWIPPGDGCPVGGVNVVGVFLMDYTALPLPPPDNAITAKGVWTHELGHMIGFRHEHPWAPGQGGCPEAPTMPSLDVTGRRLTAYDQTSVMHYPFCGGISGVDLAISALDGEGARSIYGMPAAWYVPSVI